MSFLSLSLSLSLSRSLAHTHTHTKTTNTNTNTMQHPASFVTLRTKDGFLVSASYDNETRVVQSPVSIQSTVGGSCCVLDPWSRTGYRSKSHSRVQVRDNTGNSVDLVWSNKIDARGYFVLSFNTTAGRHYNLSLSE